jgi:hypothetical protein
LVGFKFGGFDGLGDLLVQIEPGEAEFFAPVLVDQLHRRAVLLAALEIVARDVVAKNALGQLVVLEQRASR